MIEVSIPCLSSGAADGSGRARTMFRVEVLFNGRKHFVLKRHSEFNALHKKDILRSTDDVPQEMLDFLQVKHFPTINKTYSLESLNDSQSEDYSCRLLHQRVVGFSKDPYILASTSDFLPDVVVDGVLQGLYPRDIRVSFTPCTKPWSPEESSTAPNAIDTSASP
ncbi:sorting nexin-22 isoform X2 [Amia ocellicauda]|uniref:sorting nexin-22 isoform X2 n=1 Tax=Amia ocellicauda TaxID=2972642 RepID=UPI003464A814